MPKASSTNKLTSDSKQKKNPTVSEMRSWYENNKKIIENYEAASDAIKQLRDITKTTTKNISTFNKDTLRTYLQNIGSNEKNIRNLSWYQYYRSQTYARIVNMYANMFCLDARSVIPEYDLVKGADTQKTLKSYQETLDILNNLHLQQEFYNVFLTCFIQDIFYGLVFYDETGVFIFQIPADYAKISGKYMTGDFAYAIDMSYFKSRQELLEYMPDPLQTMYNEYTSTNQKWVQVPDEYCICMKFRSEDYESVIPPFIPIFNAIINLSDLEDIQAIANEQQIYKMIWLELETINGSDSPDDWKVDPDIVIKYFNRMLEEALPEYATGAIIPGKLNTISFNETDPASDTNKVEKATETVLNTAGGAEVLNGATINNTTAFKAAITANTEYAISSLLPQCQSWVNRFLSYQLSNPSKVKFFPISVYTREDYKKSLLEAAQYGLPTKLAYNSINGFSEKDTLALNFLEEEVLKLHDLMKYPLSSSFTSNTTSTDPTGENGAPRQDDTELTDDAEKSREKRDRQ